MNNAITHNNFEFSVGPVTHTFKYALVNGKPKKNFSVAVLEYIIKRKKNKIISEPLIDWDKVDSHIYSIEELTKEEYEEYIKGIVKNKKEA